MINKTLIEEVKYIAKLNGFAIVELKNKLNLIDTNGKLLSQQWFNSYDEAYDYLMKLK